MLTRRIRGAPGALAMLVLLTSLLVTPARAGDQVQGDDTDDGWKKVLAYGRCALNVFRAVTPVDWTVAFLDCGRLYLEESPTPVGGRP